MLRLVSLWVGQLLFFWAAQEQYNIFFISFSLIGLSFLFRNLTRIYAGYLTCGVVGMWLSLPTPIHSTLQRSIAGVVYESPKRSRPGLVEISFASSDGKFSCKAKDLPWLNSSKLKKGDSAKLLVTLSPFKKSNNPFSFDSQKWIQGKSSHCKIIASTSAIKSDPDLIVNHKNYFLSKLFASVQNRSTGGVMAAMSVGDTSKITSVIDRSFRESGLYHLLVVSGYQVMFLFILIKQSLFFLFNKRHQESGLAKLLGVIAGLLFSVYFGLIAGLESATERALLAVVISQLIILVGLKNNSKRDLICAALLLSLLYPGIFLTPSFELTFAALFGLSVSSNTFKNRIYQGILSTISATSSAGIVSLIWFGSITLLGLPMNIVFAPLFSIITTAGTLLGVMALILTGSNLLVSYCEFGTNLLLGLVKEISSIAPLIPTQVNALYTVLSAALVMFLAIRSQLDFKRRVIASRVLRRKKTTFRN